MLSTSVSSHSKSTAELDVSVRTLVSSHSKSTGELVVSVRTLVSSHSKTTAKHVVATRTSKAELRLCLGFRICFTSDTKDQSQKLNEGDDSLKDHSAVPC